MKKENHSFSLKLRKICRSAHLSEKCSYVTTEEKKGNNSAECAQNATVTYAFNVATADRKETSIIQNIAITHSKKKSNLNF